VSDEDEQRLTWRGEPVKAPGRQAALRGNLRGEVHGGAAAYQAVQRGEPFTGLALQAEQAISEELELGGRLAVVERNARRLQAAADLYWAAFLGACDAGDLPRVDSYVKRYGWLAGAALRAWREVREEERAEPQVNYDQLILELKDGNRGS
jgi:hypothetical protein